MNYNSLPNEQFCKKYLRHIGLLEHLKERKNIRQNKIIFLERTKLLLKIWLRRFLF